MGLRCTSLCSALDDLLTRSNREQAYIQAGALAMLCSSSSASAEPSCSEVAFRYSSYYVAQMFVCVLCRSFDLS